VSEWHPIVVARILLLLNIDVDEGEQRLDPVEDRIVPKSSGKYPSISFRRGPVQPLRQRLVLALFLEERHVGVVIGVGRARSTYRTLLPPRKKP
jgi:hypothetical protein